jgi:hypothetical protein
VGGLVGGLTSGRVGGLVLGFVAGFMPRSAIEDQQPRRMVRWHLPHASGLAVGLAVGLAFGFGFGLAFGLATGLVGGLATGLVVGLGFGLVAVPADLTEAASPTWVLYQDRAAFRTYGLAVGLVGGLAAGLPYGLAFGLVVGLVVGLAAGQTETAWGKFVLTSAWLAARGQLPRSLAAFLADAHEKRGVLRQVGPMYQFRHRDLQHRLANR